MLPTRALPCAISAPGIVNGGTTATMCNKNQPPLPIFSNTHAFRRPALPPGSRTDDTRWRRCGAEVAYYGGMGNNAVVARLREELGKDAVLTDADVTDGYARDMMPLAPVGKPLAVVLPVDVAGVQATVRACADAKGPIVPRAAGSG